MSWSLVGQIAVLAVIAIIVGSVIHSMYENHKDKEVNRNIRLYGLGIDDGTEVGE